MSVQAALALTTVVSLTVLVAGAAFDWYARTRERTLKKEAIVERDTLRERVLLADLAATMKDAEISYLSGANRDLWSALSVASQSPSVERDATAGATAYWNLEVLCAALRVGGWSMDYDEHHRLKRLAPPRFPEAGAVAIDPGFGVDIDAGIPVRPVVPTVGPLKISGFDFKADVAVLTEDGLHLGGNVDTALIFVDFERARVTIKKGAELSEGALAFWHVVNIMAKQLAPTLPHREQLHAIRVEIGGSGVLGQSEDGDGDPLRMVRRVLDLVLHPTPDVTGGSAS